MTIRTRIDSETSRFYKFVFPYLWLCIILAGLIIGYLSARTVNLVSLSAVSVLLFGITLLIFRWSSLLKMVSIDDDNLIVSDFSEELTIPCSDVVRIEQPFYRTFNPESVTVHLRIRTRWVRNFPLFPSNGRLTFCSTQLLTS